MKLRLINQKVITRSALAGAICLCGSAVFSQAATSLPVDRIQHIINAEGSIENGILGIGISRDDLGDARTSPGVVLTPDFEISGDLFFQPLPHGEAFFNGDLAMPEEEVNPFISTLLAHGLLFQAFHQHLPSDPQVWFVHFRGTGDPIALARAVKAALNVTKTPFPQVPPAHPTTPFDAERLGKILHGSPSIDAGGVVTVWVYHKKPIYIDGIRVNPQANISTNIEFKPIGHGGQQAAAVSDFSMRAEEIAPVVNLMLNHLGWYQGCLYNQEIGENPQLFFDHMLKTGNAYELAGEIRRGLDLTDAE